MTSSEMTFERLDCKPQNIKFVVDMSGPVPIVFRPVLQLTINTVEALQIREKKGVPVRRLQVFLWCKFFSPSSIHSNSNRTGVTI